MAGRRNGNHRRKWPKKRNRYDPARPNWLAVHAPYEWSKFLMRRLALVG